MSHRETRVRSNRQNIDIKKGAFKLLFLYLTSTEYLYNAL